LIPHCDTYAGARPKGGGVCHADDFVVDSQNESSNHFQLRLDFSDPNGGTFKFRPSTGVRQDDDEDNQNWLSLFEFDFVPQSNLIPQSTGKWLFHPQHPSILTTPAKIKQISGHGYYQFIAAGQNKFIINVFPSQHADVPEFTIYYGDRAVIVAEKTFWQKYGTMLMLGGLFLVNILVKSRNRNSMFTPPPPTTASTTPTTSTGTTGSTSTEKSKKKSKKA